MRNKIYIFFLALPMLLLNACSPFGLAIGAGAMVGSIALEERGVKQATRDRISHAKIMSELASIDPILVGDISLEVIEGRALAVGRVNDQQQRARIIQQIWLDSNILEVIDHIKVGTGDGIDQKAYDVTILTKLKSRLFGDQDIMGVNYGFEVLEGGVYVLGIAQSDAELQAVLNQIYAIERVRYVKHYVLLKDSPQRFDLKKQIEFRLLEQAQQDIKAEG
ncbi:MAG: BON domain-containing protein [Alphaproteobacteria bacterium]